MLFLTCSLFLGILTAIAFFSLAAIRMTGSHQEQRTAIEAATLAAARSLSAIVIEDPYFGFISLSDHPATGTGTMAGDNYYLSVKGINTLLATVRLDMSIANWLSNPTMKQYAWRDYDHAMAARTRLWDALNNAVQPGGSGKDINGNVVSPYDDALAAYQSNIIRMTGGMTNLAANSLKLSLGYEQNLTTNTPYPQPDGIAQIQPDQVWNGCYRPFVNIPFGGKDFVFAATGDETRLLDFRHFQQKLDGLPYEVPTVVRCEADQRYTQLQNNRLETHLVHCAACAQPASEIDRHPETGVLAVALPNGMVTEFPRLGAILTDSEIVRSPADLVAGTEAGDAPPSPLVKLRLDCTDLDNPMFDKVFSIAMYDWIRFGGPKVNVDSLIQALNAPLSNAQPAGAAQTHIWRFNNSGGVDYQVLAAVPSVTTPVSHKQFMAVTGLAARNTNSRLFDVIVKDYVYQPGRQKGGIHAGEPFGGSKDTTPPIGDADSKRILEELLSTQEFPTGPRDGAVRPTYQKAGIAVEIRLRARSS